ncbi:MAG: hypothetical protein H6581_02075 [Bacteroidia bacterium]|nr:hypothetical protein [Bacteroidia bacterium]
MAETFYSKYPKMNFPAGTLLLKSGFVCVLSICISFKLYGQDTIIKKTGFQIQPNLVHSLTMPLGIGTSNPEEMLHVVGGTRITGPLRIGEHSLVLEANPVQTGPSNNIYTTPNSGALMIQSQSGNNQNTIINSGNDGFVGIGKNNPFVKLVISSAASPAIFLQDPSQTANLQMAISQCNTCWSWAATPGDIVIGAKAGGSQDLILTAQNNNNGAIRLTTGNTGQDFERMTITHSGNIGIGNRNPASRLDVQGYAFFRGPNTYNSPGSYLSIGHDGGNAVIDGFGPSPNLLLNYYSGKDLVIGNPNHPNGPSDVKISGKLSVCNMVETSEVWVHNLGWCDYVFEENYPLIPLSNLEDYINEFKHLPNFPPAELIETHGQNLGELQVKMMEKIEELTLYVLELNKENQFLKERISKLETTQQTIKQ